MFGPIIEGQRIRLVPVTLEMLSNYPTWFADSEVNRYVGVTGVPTMKYEQDWYDRIAASKEDIVWAIVVGDKHIGTTGIHRIDWRNRHALTGNMIGEKSEWGKGYGSEAVRLRTRYAFFETPLEKLETEVFMDNIGSRRCLEKVGYRQYGTARRHIFRHGKWNDMWLADLLRDEWMALQDR